MWKITDHFNNRNKAQLIEELKNRLLELKTKIAEIQTLEVGINGADFDKNSDVALVTDFANFEDLAAYAIHPEHLKLVQFVREISVAKTAVDYEY